VNPIVKEFVLPDFKVIKKGFVRNPIQYLTHEEHHKALKLA